jgi:hypothetical protein
MKIYLVLITLFLLTIQHPISAQVYGSCAISDHADDRTFTKAGIGAQFKGSLKEYFQNRWRLDLPQTEGGATIYILIKKDGKVCCSQIGNNTSGLSSNTIQNSVDEMPDWEPAKVPNGVHVNFRAVLSLMFDHGRQ